MERRGSRREGGGKGGMERDEVRVISLVYILWVSRLWPQGRCDNCKRELLSASNKWLFWSSYSALKGGSFNKGCYLTSLETLSSCFPLNILDSNELWKFNMLGDLLWDETTPRLKFSFAEAWQSRDWTVRGTTVDIQMSVPRSQLKSYAILMRLRRSRDINIRWHRNMPKD